MKKLLPVILALVFSTACSSVQAIPNINNEDQVALAANETDELSSPFIYEGVMVGGIDVSGKNLETVRPLLEKDLGSRLDNEITFSYGDKTYTYSLEDLGLSIDYEKTAKEALRVGREGSAEERQAIIDDLKENPVYIEPVTSLDESAMEKVAREIANDLNIEPVQAEYSYDSESDRVVGVNGRDGILVKERDLVEAGLAAIEEGQTSVEIPVEVSNMQTDAEENAARVNGIIGSAESTFNAGYWPRAENVRVSNAYLNGLVIGPGETWSFNDYIGDTTYEKGYQEAVVINENNEQVPGMGGGVCQTSTALYHAVLKAELEVVNRVPHTQIMPYSPPGLDAAVEYGSAELAFKNPYDFPILLKTYSDGAGWIEIEIWGDTNVKSHTTSLFSEQQANTADGWLVYSSYRTNENTGEVEHLGETYYPPVSTWQ